MFDREKQGAYALEVEARDGAPSARPNSNGQPNSGKFDTKNKIQNLFTCDSKSCAMKKNCKFESVLIRN